MKIVLRLLSIIVLMAALGGGYVLVKKNQNLQKGAAANATSGSILPSSVNVIVGQNFDVHVWINTGSDADKLVGAEFSIGFNDTNVEFVSAAAQNGYTILNDNLSGANNYTKVFKMVTLGEEKAGAVELVKLTFKALTSVGGTVVITPGAKIMVSGQTTTWDVATLSAGNLVGDGSPTPGVLAKVGEACRLGSTPGIRCETGLSCEGHDGLNGICKVPTEIACEWCGRSCVASSELVDTKRICTRELIEGATCSSVGGVCTIVQTTTVAHVTPTVVPTTVLAATPTIAGALTVTVVPTVIPAVSPTVVPTAVPTLNGVDYALNYKVSLMGVNPNSAKCIGNVPLKITVRGGGQSKEFTGVVPSTKEVVGNKLVFGGSINLTGFNVNSGVSAFISGPKHLQMKYGNNNQSDNYNKADGELVLTKGNSLIYDFSNYPLLAGDDNQDGVINGVDFAYIKSKALIHETVAEGQSLRGDLDGNCQINSNDINILKMSLQEKQGQLY